MIDEIHITITTYQGIQAGIEVNTGDRWRYLRAGISEVMIDAVYGTATPDEVDETMRELARGSGEAPARCAAGHLDHARKLFEYERNYD